MFHAETADTAQLSRLSLQEEQSDFASVTAHECPLRLAVSISKHNYDSTHCPSALLPAHGYNELDEPATWKML